MQEALLTSSFHSLPSRPFPGLLLAIAALLSCAMGCNGSNTSKVEVDESSDNQLSAQFGASDLALSKPVNHPVGLLREPMLVQHSDGTLFLSGYGSQSADRSDPRQVPPLYSSTDQGDTWTAVDVGTAADGAIGNSDVDLAIGPHGTIYFVAMGFSRTTFRGTHIAIGVSGDVGQTWKWHLLSDTEFDDRPWVAVTPDAVAHVVWNDGAGVKYARSADHGETWSEQDQIHGAGGSSHFAAGPGGELALRISPMSASANRFDKGVDLIKVSLDGGTTWQERPLPGEPRWPTSPEEFARYQRWVEPLVWDSDGSLWHLWSEQATLSLARSADHGATWQRWTVAESNDQIFYPFFAAQSGSLGSFAASWFEGQGDELRARIARITAAGTGQPMTQVSAPLALELYTQTQQGDATARVRATGGEYFPVAFLDDGSIGAVTTLESGETGGFTWWRSTSR